MAQLTGTQIDTLARYWAKDSGTNKAVSTVISLELLNDVLLRWTGDVVQRPSVIPASSSGLTFTSGDTNVTTTTGGAIAAILSAHPSNTNAANDLLSPPLDYWAVNKMLCAYSDSGGGTATAGGNEWQAYAWETVAGDADKLRVYVYPALSATRHLTIRATTWVTLNALGDTPDISLRDARCVARLLGWEIARLHTRDEAFLNQIIAPIPKALLAKYFESGLKAGQADSRVVDRGVLGV